MQEVKTTNLSNYYKRKRRKKIIRRRVILLISLLLAATVSTAVVLNIRKPSEDQKVQMLKTLTLPDYVDEQFIKHHSTARTGKELDGINNIVLHYVGNPGSTAQNNRDYFNKSSTSVSSHFVVGLEGEIIQCLPLWERSAASNDRNHDTISVEVCHPDKDGRFNEKTYNSVIKLISWLIFKLGLDETAIIRHYDITGKLCPLYYVEHEDEWNILKEDIKHKLYEYKKE